MFPLFPYFFTVTSYYCRASSGLGRELSRHLYLRGYNIVIIASAETALKEFKNELESTKSSLSPEQKLIHLTNSEGQVNISSTFVPGKVADGSAHQTKKMNSFEHTNEVRNCQSSTSSSRAGRNYPQRIEIISCDLRDPLAPFYILQQLKARNIDDKIDVLINNAGIASRNRFIHESFDNLHDIVELNIQSALSLTRLLAPQMGRRSNKNRNRNNSHNIGARIMFVSSLAAAGPGPNVAAYSASSHPYAESCFQVGCFFERYKLL